MPWGIFVQKKAKNSFIKMENNRQILQNRVHTGHGLSNFSKENPYMNELMKRLIIIRLRITLLIFYCLELNCIIIIIIIFQN